jgi:ribosomal protein S18 acetylase RimI-like enzyme
MSRESVHAPRNGQSMRIDITSANKEDLNRLHQIFSNRDLKMNIEESRWFVNCYFNYHHVNIAKVEEEIQGACFWRIEGELYCGLGWIENLWVEERSRRTGLGERLLEKSVEDMKVFYGERDIILRKIALTTQIERRSARRLYEKLGFRSVATLGEMYDRGEETILYVLDL